MLPTCPVDSCGLEVGLRPLYAIGYPVAVSGAAPRERHWPPWRLESIRLRPQSALERGAPTLGGPHATVVTEAKVTRSFAAGPSLNRYSSASRAPTRATAVLGCAHLATRGSRRTVWRCAARPSE